MTEDDLRWSIEIERRLNPATFSEPLYRQRAERSPQMCLTGRARAERAGYIVAFPWTDTAPPSPRESLPMPAVVPTVLFVHRVVVLPAFRAHRATMYLIDQMRDLAAAHDLRALVGVTTIAQARLWRDAGFEADVDDEVAEAVERAYGAQSIFMSRPVNARTKSLR